LKPSRVLAGLEPVTEEGFRRPTTAEAKDYFLIASDKTIRNWWRKREKIFGGDIPAAYPPRWPRLEKKLVKQFTAAKKSKKIVTIHWFRRVSKQIWNRLYPSALAEVFFFSNGWFWRFLRRHNIVRRRITKVAIRSPTKVVNMANSFIKYIRQHGRREDVFASMALRSSPPGNADNVGGGHSGGTFIGRRTRFANSPLT
jgi:hypothetical protein